MKHIATVQDVVTAFADWMEPTSAELDAIEVESAVVLAEVDLLDAQIKAMDRPVNEVDARRIRRARNRVLAARRDVANRTVGEMLPGGAA
ncbi:conserved hypothetical protein [Streptomyces scabiei 87.22]|uniref:Uncharacterized protein n=1 Tax=Streptomyces scabiei (strain 87.22) TaxID=680198 RepID=C9YWM7_STRSW|nr:DUF6284 family protein [Streptomyces scabiei]MDX2574447.1 DUF6284 family protein [Streptomyces scabiei]MDX2653696.1 DUF6284 family protein [Streptomyces scabiei]MDX2721935.1 DUF6284 family protein [Streptomyces scabiei]MDX2865479.1 DUF6284 family protein [Streptomyces scabiei]MDX2884197.1 DUF6284 family protein [Streptomyces scabiei]